MFILKHIERMQDDIDFRDLILGIQAHKVEQSVLNKCKFYYAGGDSGRHRNYFMIRYGCFATLLQHQDRCVCGVHIKENCYITDDDVYFLVIGNCCIKRFLPKENQGRTCSNCKKPHRNSKDNFCKDCRPKIPKGRFCEECGEQHYNRKDNLCNNCRYMRKNNYDRCQDCNDWFRNKKDVLCANCRFKFDNPDKCEICEKHHDNKKNKKLCEVCAYITGKCSCGKSIDQTKYNLCYTCHKEKKEEEAKKVKKKCEKCSKTIADKYRYCYDCYKKPIEIEHRDYWDYDDDCSI